MANMIFVSKEDLSNSVQRVLNRLDPLGVSPAVHAPENEYELEAGKLVQLLLSRGQLFPADIRNVGSITLRDADWIPASQLGSLIGELHALMQ